MPDIESTHVTALDGVETVLRCKGPRDAGGVILIHGILHCSLIWKHQFADPALRGIRLVAYDIRGHGAADKPSAADAYRPANFADDLHAVIHASGIARPVLVGWSLGTRMAFNYLDKYGSGAIGGLVICGAQAKKPPGTADAGQSTILQACSDDLDTRLQARIAFTRACHAVPPASGDMTEIAACSMLIPPHILRHFAGRAMDYEALLASLRIPVRVLHGAQDPVCSVAAAERLQIVNPQADLTVYPELGHTPFFEDPTRFNRDLLAFVHRCQHRVYA